MVWSCKKEKEGSFGKGLPFQSVQRVEVGLESVYNLKNLGLTDDMAQGKILERVRIKATDTW